MLDALDQHYSISLPQPGVPVATVDSLSPSRHSAVLRCGFPINVAPRLPPLSWHSLVLGCDKANAEYRQLLNVKLRPRPLASRINILLPTFSRPSCHPEHPPFRVLTFARLGLFPASSLLSNFLPLTFPSHITWHGITSAWESLTSFELDLAFLVPPVKVRPCGRLFFALQPQPEASLLLPTSYPAPHDILPSPLLRLAKPWPLTYCRAAIEVQGTVCDIEED